MIKQQLLNLRQHLFSGKQYYQTEQSVVEGNISSPIDLWVISRKLCLFFVQDFSAVPEANREAALATKVRGLSPFPKPGYWASWQQDVASIWIWNRELIDVAQQGYFATEPVPNNLQVLPESVFSGLPSGNSRKLYQCEGYSVGQIWKDGQLLGEQWWINSPTGEQWLEAFTGIDEAHQLDRVPELESLSVFDNEPWPSSVAFSVAAKHYERPILVGVLALFLICVVYQLSGLVRLGITEWQLSRKLDESQVRAEEIMNVREQAYTQLERSRLLAELNSAGQLSIMASVTEVLPNTAGTVLKWSFNRGALEFVLHDRKPNLAEYVTNLEQHKRLTNVRAEPTGNNKQVKLQMDVSSL